MIDQIVFTANNDAVAEGSRLNVTAYFRDQTTKLGVVPTTIEWALRDPDRCREIQALTPFTPPAVSATLVTTAAMNTCRSIGCNERREITVIVDRTLSTQFSATYVYQVRNIGAVRPI